MTDNSSCDAGTVRLAGYWATCGEEMVNAVKTFIDIDMRLSSDN
jgi:hypothetical protein